MSIRGDGIKLSVLRGWVAHLLLLAFALRALVPAGYMPDFGAAGHGVFKVVVCSSYGSKILSLNADGQVVADPQTGNSSDHQDSKHDQPCAFSGLAAISLLPLDLGPLDTPDDATVALISRPAITLPPARAGPPVGSRGPPQIS